MGTLVDGLGFEELGDAGDPGSKASQVWVTGSIVTQSDIQAAGTVSGASNFYGPDYYNSEGELQSNNAGSTTTYGAKVQGGSFATSAGSAGTIEFGQQFAGTDYFVAISPGSDGACAGAGSVVPGVSGTRNVSGCEVIGAASICYNYLAVGI